MISLNGCIHFCAHRGDKLKLVRIGNKIISLEKIFEATSDIIQKRSIGVSQKEVAESFNTERAFISRLESLGEVRVGDTIGAIGFPVANKAEVESILKAYGVEFSLILSDAERYGILESFKGFELVNLIMEMVKKFMSFSSVIVLGSGERIKFIKQLLSGSEIIGFEIGRSPIEKEVHIDVEGLKNLLEKIGLGGNHEVDNEC